MLNDLVIAAFGLLFGFWIGWSCGYAYGRDTWCDIYRKVCQYYKDKVEKA